MLVAPVLAVVAYFATDYVVSERPHAAQPGKSYKLAAKSNCRYQSGLCILQNGSVEIQLRSVRDTPDQVTLTVTSNEPLTGALFSLVRDGNGSEPTRLASDNGQWTISLPVREGDNSSLRMAFSIAGSEYFAESSTAFVDYETTFSRKNFPEDEQK